MEFTRRQSPYWSARVAVPALMLQVLAALVPAAIAEQPLLADHARVIAGSGHALLISSQDQVLKSLRGTLLAVPIVNVHGFLDQSRYLPDRRDLNRCFPGSKTGSLASRLARSVFNGIVRRSDYGIDLHTAAVRRTNVPTVRADMSIPEVRRIAEAFGCELILNRKGPKKGLRPEACAAGCPTIPRFKEPMLDEK